MTVSIEVTDVELATHRTSTVSLRRAIEHQIGQEAQGWGGGAQRLVSARPGHGLLAAAYMAFAEHFPLALRPDDVWLLIAQGLAAHVRAHPATQRERWGVGEGRSEVTVRHDGIVPGDPNTPWGEVFDLFSDALAQRIGPKRDLIVPTFSTTDAAARIAAQIVLMDTLQPFTSYRLMTLCGIPRIELHGTPDDWKSVRERTRVLGEFGLAQHTQGLDPILEQLVASAEGRPQRAFWESFYKYRTMSGGNLVTGWVNAFFPYLEDDERGTIANPLAKGGSYIPASEWSGTRTDQFPSGLSKVPFTWEVLEVEHPMLFWGGFVGVSQDPETRTVRPEIGWAVGPQPPSRLASGPHLAFFAGPTPALERALRELQTNHQGVWRDPQRPLAGFDVTLHGHAVRVVAEAPERAPDSVWTLLGPSSGDASSDTTAAEAAERALAKAGSLRSTPSEVYLLDADCDLRALLADTPDVLRSFAMRAPYFDVRKRLSSSFGSSYRSWSNT